MVQVRQLWHACINASLGGFLFGYNLGVFNPCQANIAETLAWGSQARLFTVLATGVMPLGAFLGVLLGSPLTARRGRRWMLLVSDVVGILGAACSMVPQTVVFILGRFITGLAVGNFLAVPPLYICELCPPQNLSKIGCLTEVQVSLGLVFSFALGLVLPDSSSQSPLNYWWIFMFGFQIVICSVQAITFLIVFPFETVYWLKAQGYSTQAQAVLDRFEMSEEFGLVMGQPLSEFHQEVKPSYTRLLCDKETRRQVRLGMCYNAFMQLCGVNVLSFYSTMILSDLGSSEFIARVYTLLIGVFALLSVFIVMGLVNRFGRKQLTVTGGLVMAASLAVIAVLSYFSREVYLIVILVLAYRLGFSMSGGAICYLYIGEILGEQGLGLATSVNWVFVVCIAFSTPYLIEFLSFFGAMLVFAGVCILFTLYFAIDMVETRGLSREQIQAKFAST